MKEVTRIADQMERAFRGDAWHGPAVLELLDGVDAGTAAAHPMHDVHSIWEIVLHVAAWKRALVRRLKGEALELRLREDWPKVSRFDEKEWDAARQELESAHQALVEHVRTLSDARLTDTVPGKDYDNYFMLHGATQHDLYHAGQIALLRKSK